MAIASIVINDAQATPVAHTFIPLGPDKDGVLWWEDQSQASPLGYWKISFQLKRPPPGVAGQSSEKRTYRFILTMHQAVLENSTNNTVSGIQPSPTISYTPRCFVEFVMPERASLQNRKDLRKMVNLATAEAQLIAAVETLVMPF